MLDICRQAGVTVPPVLPTTSGQVRSAFFNETLPQKLEEALASSKARFDAIIADEGQDFAEDWWITLLDLLKNREHGVFYIFFDDNQRIYPRDAPLPISEAPFTLSVNCRNTDKIHDEVLQYYRGTPKPISRGPVGIAPTFESLEPGGNREALRRAFATLFTHEKLPLRSVVVLTPLSARTSSFKEGDRIGVATLTWQQNPGPNEVQVSSIYSYKGLESPVVILAELDRLDPDKKDYLLYVATSRPRDHLIVLGALPEPQNEETSLSADQRWGGDDVSF